MAWAQTLKHEFNATQGIFVHRLPKINYIEVDGIFETVVSYIVQLSTGKPVVP